VPVTGASPRLDHPAAGREILRVRASGIPEARDSEIAGHDGSLRDQRNNNTNSSRSGLRDSRSRMRAVTTFEVAATQVPRR